MTRKFCTAAGVTLAATLLAASAVSAAPQVRAPDRDGMSGIVRSQAYEDQNATPRRHNRYDYSAGQQMHTGGGGNSK